MAIQKSAPKATQAVKKAAAKRASSAKAATGRATKKTKESASKATATVRATRAARAGRGEDARQIADEADLEEGMARSAIEGTETLHYDVEVNKRGLSVSALTETLNDRWSNGWRLAHILEQRGNTVLVFEKRSSI